MASRTVSILGVRIDVVDYEETISKIKSFIKDGGHHQLVTVNPEFIVAAQTDPEFKTILNEADLSVPDGIGIKMAGLLMGQNINHRVTGTDLVGKLAAVGEKEGWKFFFLGGTQGRGVAAGKILRVKYSDLQVVGAFEGDGSSSGDLETVAAVRKAGPIDILLVAYGHPKQEKWIKRNLSKTDAKVAIGVGGAFNYLSGRTSRAPSIMRQIGLEWLYRLFREPWRFRRQLALPKFVVLVLKDRWFS
jgi:N-acetylglucosaminyldiphosphoundecaprenol N-acetyl-beta-D-mannosaminyltransferase